MKARSLLPFFLLTAAAVLTGCSRSDAGALRPSAVRDAGTPVDVETMAFLSEARALHHEADLREDTGDVRGARAQVERIVNAQRPHPGTGAPEVEEVLADAWARIAELDVRAGDPVAAAKAAQDGLAHAAGPTYFRGHLLEVQGIAEQSRSSGLADAGDSVGAARARAEAMRLLEEAVAVQEKVIASALDGGTNAGPNEGDAQ